VIWPQVEAWKDFPRQAGALSEARDRLEDMMTSTRIVIRYGLIDKYSTGIFTPAACRLS
jgi:hypothetical protein